MKTNPTNTTSIFITGANGGMGLETTKLLAKEGIGRIVMAARTEEKADTAKSILLREIQTSSEIEAVGGFDMTNPESIEAAVKALPQKPFDIIFLQAGGVVFTDDYAYVEYGGKKVERTIFQNTIGAYITLVNLKKQRLLAPKARIVFAGGEGARGIPGMIKKPVFDTVEQWNNYLLGEGTLPKYNPMNGIGVSKFASALLTQQLGKLNGMHTYLWFSPGLTHRTNGLAKVGSPIKRFVMEKVVFGISGLFGFSQSPQKGAQKYVDSLLGKVGDNGDVLGAPKGKVLGTITDQVPMNVSLGDIELQEEFWHFLQEMYMPYRESIRV